MAERVVLHVGAMKSGTSYLQSQLFANKDALGEKGILVPGGDWSDQVKAVSDVIDRPRPGQGDIKGSWQRTVDEVRAWPGTAVISMEFLGPQLPKVVRRVVASFDGAAVSAVLTVRDLNRNLAAMWQETVQNGRWWTWEEYLAGAERDRPGLGRPRGEASTAGRKFWRQQNVVRMARNWMSDEGVADFFLITVPHPGAPTEELMTRFASVVGFDPSLTASTRDNASLDAAAAEVLRRMNAVLAERGRAFPFAAGLRKQRLAKGVLARRRRADLRIGLPVAEWVESHAERMVGNLRGLGLEPVGEWSDLIPVPLPGVHPGSVPEDVLREKADDAVRELGPALVRLRGKDWQGHVAAVTGKDETDTAIRRLAALIELTLQAPGAADA